MHHAPCTISGQVLPNALFACVTDSNVFLFLAVLIFVTFDDLTSQCKGPPTKPARKQRGNQALNCKRLARIRVVQVAISINSPTKSILLQFTRGARLLIAVVAFCERKDCMFTRARVSGTVPWGQGAALNPCAVDGCSPPRITACTAVFAAMHMCRSLNRAGSACTMLATDTTRFSKSGAAAFLLADFPGTTTVLAAQDSSLDGSGAVIKRADPSSSMFSAALVLYRWCCNLR